MHRELGPAPRADLEGISEGDVIACAVLSGNRNFEARIHSEVKANYLASPPLVVVYALAGRMDIDLATEPIGVGSDGRDVFLADIWPSPDEVKTIAGAVGDEMFRATYADVFTGDATWRELPVPEASLRLGPRVDVRPPARVLRGDAADAWSRRGLRRAPPRPDRRLRDDRPHLSCGLDQARLTAGRYLIERGVERREFNSYGSRRGNHEVMVRGTFANVRLRNCWPKSEELDRPPAFRRRADDLRGGRALPRDDVPLIVLAGKEYGSGSSRDWAAKGPKLLGVRAVIAESYERIHRSNLLMMGVLPRSSGPARAPSRSA